MKLVTISREFGSGGRELGKRLADALGFAYCDREIVAAVARRTAMDETYLERRLEHAADARIPLTFSRTLAEPAYAAMQDSYLLARQHGIVRELAAQGDCVIVGRAADALLKEFHPFSVFVYADMPSKIARCRACAAADEARTDREWERKIREVDRARAKSYALVSADAWADMHHYTLCLDTSGADIKAVVPWLADYARRWLERNAQ